MEDVSSEGLCVISVFQKDIGSLTEDDNIYNTFFIANDIFISTIRIISVFGQLLALVNLVRMMQPILAFALFIKPNNYSILIVALLNHSNKVIVWGSLFAIFPKDILENATITFYMVLLTFVCEGLKISMMFMTSPCDDDEFWERDSGFHKADQCFVGRGCYMSITATTLYLGIIVHILLSMIYIDYTHVTDSNLEYDDISMPSYLQSIAGSVMSSVMSKISSDASRISSQGSSNQRSRGSGEKSRESGDSFQRSSDGSGGNSIISATGNTGNTAIYAATRSRSMSSVC